MGRAVGSRTRSIICETIIIYGSLYGTAKHYAEALSNRTGVAAVPYDHAHDVAQYDAIVYIGALYAGGVLGMKKTFRGLSDVRGRTIIIATVGLADPSDRQNIENIRQNMKKQLPEQVCQHAQFFHLRGGIDYSRLSAKHRIMMRLLYEKARNLPEEKKTAEVRAMIETYNKRVNFTDDAALDRMILAMPKGEIS